MRDFTLSTYRCYLTAIKNSGGNFLRFQEYLSSTHLPDEFVLLRHDVDRKPKNALAMAQLEADLGIPATYYFRDRNFEEIAPIIEQICALGHEVGYHYECLSDSNGDFEVAYEMFEESLNKFRKITLINTVSMHGSPLKPYDNRDMWRGDLNRAKLFNLDILGEIYLQIDYSDVAYINDTGRNWLSNKSNRRDKVDSNILAEFETSKELLAYFERPHKKLVFQVHPERWSESLLPWIIQLIKDGVINLTKSLLQLLRR